MRKTLPINAFLLQGSNLAVLPLDTKGRLTKANIPLIYAHSDFVTDFKFSPFDDGLLATGSNDTSVSYIKIRVLFFIFLRSTLVYVLFARVCYILNC